MFPQARLPHPGAIDRGNHQPPVHTPPTTSHAKLIKNQEPTATDTMLKPLNVIKNKNPNPLT
jgi:hypothetical protein